MRCAARFTISALLTVGIVLLVVLYFLKGEIETIWEQYDITTYLQTAIKASWHHADFSEAVPWESAIGDKVIVMAKTENEDTDWVETDLPDWQQAVYIVNPSRPDHPSPHQLYTPLNKGHESMAYLTYVIDFYNDLPSTIAFLHSHRSGFLSAWHVDDALHDNVHAMRQLQLPFVQSNGYVNLRCNWNPGCTLRHAPNDHITREVWHDVFSETSTSAANSSSRSVVTDYTSPADPEAAEKAKYSRPPSVNAACCAQFAVSRDQVRKRPVEDYMRFRRWVMETDKTDAQSGRVMEYLWHIIFGKNAV